MKMSPKEFSVSTFCNHRDWFTVNEEYQRESGVWSDRDKKHLIDSIIKQLDIPKIYLGKKGQKHYEIIDGQQRIQTIREFRDNEFSLDGEISGPNLNGVKYRDLPQTYVENFDDYKFQCVIVTDYSDKDIRRLFRKLQRGKPLNWREKLNAYPGSIVPVMRKLGNHRFFKKVSFPLRRYKAYGIASRFLLLEEKGITDVTPRYIREFFRRHSDMTIESKIPKKVRKVLNYLNKTFSNKIPELDKEKWIINLYLLTSYLLDRFAMKDKKRDLREYYIDCWREINQARMSGKGPEEVMKFVEANTSGTTSKKNIKTRFEYMVEEFLSGYPDLPRLDPKRSFDRYERISIWRNQDKKCAECGDSVSFKNFEAHHVKPHSKGGQTLEGNGKGLCSDCHRRK